MVVGDTRRKQDVPKQHGSETEQSEEASDIEGVHKPNYTSVDPKYHMIDFNGASKEQTKRNWRGNEER